MSTLLAAASPAPEGSGLLPSISLVIFVTLFVGILLFLVLTRKERWAKDARIPLEPDPVEPRTPPASSKEPSSDVRD